MLVILGIKDVDSELAKASSNPNHIPLFQLARELSQPDRKRFCKIKVKNLAIGQGFFNKEEVYISYRTKLPTHFNN